MKLLDGKMVANKRKELLKQKIGKFNSKPGFAVICIGDDPASQIYIRAKHKMCDELGIYVEEHIFPSEVTQKEIEERIMELNRDDKIHGILVQSPVPYHINIMELFEKISPKKDVDGFHPLNVGKLSQGQNEFAPCTPLGIMHLLEEYGISAEGKNCVVIGRSNIVGRPMAQLLMHANGTVTVCHSKTKGLSEITKQADLLIVAIGKPNFIVKDMIKEGCVIVDVGINRKENSKEICGDVDFENVKEKCSYITPVPGGVGPMTIITLMENIVRAYERLNK